MLSDTEKASHLGFLTVIDHPASGFHGGFLLVNSVGRPLEFHCTVAVKPNRAQEVLFGDSLKPYLFGEQIAQTLIQRVQGLPLCVFSDSVAVLAVQRFVELPILYVPARILHIPQVAQIAQPETHDELAMEQTGQIEETEQIRQNETENSSLPNINSFDTDLPNNGFEPLANIPGLNVDHWKQIEIARYPLWFSDTHEEIVQTLWERLLECSKTIDFAEPFSRIRLALDEAQKAA